MACHRRLSKMDEETKRKLVLDKNLNFFLSLLVNHVMLCQSHSI